MNWSKILGIAKFRIASHGITRNEFAYMVKFFTRYNYLHYITLFLDVFWWGRIQQAGGDVERGLRYPHLRLHVNPLGRDITMDILILEQIQLLQPGHPALFRGGWS